MDVILHDSKVNIMCNTQVHVDSENRIETIMIKGNVKRIKDLTQKYLF